MVKDQGDEWETTIQKQIWLSKYVIRLETTSLGYQQSQVSEGRTWHLVNLHVHICEWARTESL